MESYLYEHEHQLWPVEPYMSLSESLGGLYHSSCRMSLEGAMETVLKM
jgi:hypothetical protein